MVHTSGERDDRRKTGSWSRIKRPHRAVAEKGAAILGLLLLLQGCATRGGQMSLVKPGKVVAVVLVDDTNPFQWSDPQVISELRAGDAAYLLYLLQRELAAAGIFEQVVRYDEADALRAFPPSMELALYGAWFARDLGPAAAQRAAAGRQIPVLGGWESERRIGERSGLVMRFELKDLRTNKPIQAWCSFSEVAFDGRVPVLLQPFIEEPLRPALAAVADSVGRPAPEKPRRTPLADPPTAADQQIPLRPYAGNATAAIQVPLGTGIFLTGRSSYQVQRDFLRPPQSAAEIAGSPVYAFFGTTNERIAGEEVASIHEDVLALLAKAIEASPLGVVRWNGEYRLAFDIMALDFDFPASLGADQVQPICTAQVGVSLQRLTDQRTLLEQVPPLIIQFRKAKPGGGQTLDGLKAQIAEKLQEWLSEYWFAPRRD